MIDNKRKIIELCTLLINGDIDLIEGCRKLTLLCEQIDEGENEIFFPIISVDSETDHFPVGAMREHCSKEYLEGVDKEVSAYIREIKPDIINSCREIVSFLSIKN